MKLNIHILSRILSFPIGKLNLFFKVQISISRDEAKLQLDVCMGGNVVQELASYPDSIIDYEVEPNCTCAAEVFGKSKLYNQFSFYSILLLSIHTQKRCRKDVSLLLARHQLGFHSTLCHKLWFVSWQQQTSCTGSKKRVLPMRCKTKASL